MTATPTTITAASAAAFAQRPSRQPSALELLRQPPLSSPAPAPQRPELPLASAFAFRFSPEQCAALAAPLDRAHVRQREQGRGRVSYLEGWQVIAEANRIFGFDGWQRQTVLVRCVAERPRKIGSEPRRPTDPPQRDGWGVTYIAKVRIAVGDLLREGTGAGHGIDVDPGLAHESALKEAETDATKRALMTFGNPFGLALYDKQQRQVSGPGGAPASPRQRPSNSGPRPTGNGRVGREAQKATPTARPSSGDPRSAGPAAAPTEPPSPSAPVVRQAPNPAEAPNPSLDLLDPQTIRQLQATIRALPLPVLEAFTKAFRKRFAVPQEAATIADRILQKQHHDWIEAFLVQHQPPRPSEPGHRILASTVQLASSPRRSTALNGEHHPDHSAR